MSYLSKLTNRSGNYAHFMTNWQYNWKRHLVRKSILLLVSYIFNWRSLSFQYCKQYWPIRRPIATWIQLDSAEIGKWRDMWNLFIYGHDSSSHATSVSCLVVSWNRQFGTTIMKGQCNEQSQGNSASGKENLPPTCFAISFKKYKLHVLIILVLCMLEVLAVISFSKK